jgi:hypothetical protein
LREFLLQKWVVGFFTKVPMVAVSKMPMKNNPQINAGRGNRRARRCDPWKTVLLLDCGTGGIF